LITFRQDRGQTSITMARPGVTYHDIANAATELKGQGKNVTIENVRSILGTGSIGTINNHLRKWKEAQSLTQKMPSAENLPQNLIALMKGLWEGVITESAEQFHPTEEAYKQEISELKSELAKYKNNNQRWQKLFNQWQQEKIQLANEKLTLEQALEFSHKENQTLRDKQDGLLHQLQEKQDRIDELHRLHQQTQRNLEHYREAAREQRLLDQEKFERDKQHYLTEIKTLKEEAVMNRHSATAIEQENSKLLESNQLLEKANTQYQHDNLQLNMEKTELEKKCHEYHITNQSHQSHTKQLQATINEQSHQMINHQAENKVLSNKMAEMMNELSDQKEQLKLALHEKWELKQEKAMMEGQLKQMQKSLVG
jgi:hypothetical protein